MEQPRAEDGERAGRHLDAGDDVVRERPPGDHPGRRVSRSASSTTARAYRQRRDVGPRRRPAGEDGVELGVQAALHLGCAGEQVQRPGEARGDGLVPGDDAA